MARTHTRARARARARDAYARGAEMDKFAVKTRIKSQGLPFFLFFVAP